MEGNESQTRVSCDCVSSDPEITREQLQRSTLAILLLIFPYGGCKVFSVDFTGKGSPWPIFNGYLKSSLPRRRRYSWRPVTNQRQNHPLESLLNYINLFFHWIAAQPHHGRPSLQATVSIRSQLTPESVSDAVVIQRQISNFRICTSTGSFLASCCFSATTSGRPNQE